MAKVLYHVTMSLDGFIAGPGDDMSWLRGLIGGPNPTVDAFLPQIGALLIGANTFSPATSAEGAPYGGAWTGPMFVLTHDDEPSDAPGFTFLNTDLATGRYGVERRGGPVRRRLRRHHRQALPRGRPPGRDPDPRRARAAGRRRAAVRPARRRPGQPRLGQPFRGGQREQPLAARPALNPLSPALSLAAGRGNRLSCLVACCFTGP
jgi:hypothetical protein